jgi:hypothetical protein
VSIFDRKMLAILKAFSTLASANMIFELQYTKDGSRVIETIESDWKSIREIGKELAESTGRRTIIRPKQDRPWKVYAVDLESGHRVMLWQGITKDDALLRWQIWDEERTQSVLICLPSVTSIRHVRDAMRKKA